MQYVIVGNGIAGLTAARHLRKRNGEAKIIIISKETLYPFSRPGLMYINTDRVLPKDLELYERWFYPKNRIELIQAEVKNIDTESKKVMLDNNQSIDYDKLLLATGSSPRMFSWKNVQLDGIYNYNSLTDALNMKKIARKGKKAVVVGGGLTGLEVVECLHLQGIHVTYLVREKWYFDRALNENEAKLVENRLIKLGVEFRKEEEIDEFVGRNHVVAVKTTKGNEIPCNMAYITIGVVSNIKLAKNAGLNTGRGILVNENQKTSKPDVFAAGDCAEIPTADGKTTVELLWYSARDQGEVAALNMVGIEKKYNTGIFYNYARFLDMDYATIGKTNLLAENEKSTEYIHPKKNVSIRIIHDDKKVIGFNMLGARWKRDVLEAFIENKNSLEYVLKNLKKASFNPEFSRNYIKELIHA